MTNRRDRVTPPNLSDCATDNKVLLRGGQVARQPYMLPNLSFHGRLSESDATDATDATYSSSRSRVNGSPPVGPKSGGSDPWTLAASRPDASRLRGINPPSSQSGPFHEVLLPDEAALTEQGGTRTGRGGAVSAALPDRLLTVSEVAAILNVAPRWVYRRANTLPFARKLSANTLRFSEAGLYRWIERRKP